jgi:hypothetical protein
MLPSDGGIKKEQSGRLVLPTNSTSRVSRPRFVICSFCREGPFEHAGCVRRFSPSNARTDQRESATMAVREFLDEHGTAWRVWCILPESIHPVTRAEDYLADCYQLGWLVFETTSGDQKRRLCPFPRDWESADEQSLCSFLAQSERVRPRRSSGEVAVDNVALRSNVPAIDGDDDTKNKADLTDLTVVRTFRYPGGRVWSAAIAPHSDIAAGPVLRFTAGARSIDLERFPRDWPDLPDDQMIDLLRHAAPRPIARYTPATPRRRYNDPPA